MGIFVKKRNFSALRILLIFLLLIFAFIALFYYFIFFDTNKINSSDNLNISNSQINENSNLNTEQDSSIYLKNQDSNSTEYFSKNEFDQIIKNFVEQNPDFILNVLREYQLNQNKLEQEKINQKKVNSIDNLNQQAHPMYLGDPNSIKVIYEFVDYNCGYCQKYHEELIKVMNKDNSIKLVIIQMPILGNSSLELSKIALASSLQDQFNVVHNYLYSPERKSKMEDILADLFLKGVDLEILKRDIDSQDVSSFLYTHKSYVDEFKFTGSPATIIGNQIIPGFIDANKIIEILEKEFSQI